MSEIFKKQTGINQNIMGLPVDKEFLFSNHKNIYKKGMEKRQTKLIEKISFIKQFLKEDERILLVTTGCSPMSFMEQFFTGWVVFYLKRSLFVITNKRIFHIPTKADYSYRNSIAQILYADCNTIEIKGRTLEVKYKNGKKEKFYYIAGKERKKLKALLKATSLDGVQSKTPGRMHLCPRCTSNLIEDEYICPKCRLEFKNKAEGKKNSILYPGGGYFYTRHWWLGVSDAIAETFLIVLVISLLVGTVQGEKDGILAFSFVLVLLVLEKVITIYHTDHFIKEYIPKEEIKPIIVSQ